MPAYSYRSLPPAGENEEDVSIRLVKLPVGDIEGPVTCQLLTCSLADPPEYDAVSYSWGDPSDKSDILCDGGTIRIPNNLRDFLVRIRATSTESFLWIDSISINQSDNLEKGSQVAAMRHIYRKAKRALIWLGEEYGESTLALETAQEFCAKYKEILNNNTSANPTDIKKPWYIPRMYSQIATVWDPKWGAFFRLIDRPYFTRAWIVQEVVVSREQWIICGEKVISWLDFFYAFVYCISYEMWLLEFYGAKNFNNLMALQLSQNEVNQGKHPMLYRVLLRHRMCISHDSRDKIFAYHGISSHNSLVEYDLKPDYTISTDELYSNLAVNILERSNNLDFLDIPRATSTSRLPSWIPDWETPLNHFVFSLLQLEITEGMLVNAVETVYQATKKSTFTPKLDSSKTRLSIFGYQVDKITALSNQWELQDTSGYSSVLKQAQVLQKNQRFVDEFEHVFGITSKSPYPTGEDRETVCWQTCIAGDFRDGKEETEKHWFNFQKRQYWLRWISRLHVQSLIIPWLIAVILSHILRGFGIPNPEIGFRTLTERLINRKAMATRDGYVGLAPGITEVGDRIILAKGGKLPLVLRQKGKYWEFIGDCYVHGFMDGERWEKEIAKGKECEEIVLI